MITWQSTLAILGGLSTLFAIIKYGASIVGLLTTMKVTQVEQAAHISKIDTTLQIVSDKFDLFATAAGKSITALEVRQEGHAARIGKIENRGK